MLQLPPAEAMSLTNMHRLLKLLVLWCVGAGEHDQSQAACGSIHQPAPAVTTRGEISYAFAM